MADDTSDPDRAPGAPGQLDVVARAHRVLSDELNRGVFAAGSRLPGERELSGRLGISRGTLRKVLARLAEEQRIEPSPHRGWYVGSSQMVSEPASELISFTEMARARGLRPTARVLDRTERPAGYEEAARLVLGPAAPLIELRRLRGLDDRPVCVETAKIPRGVAPQLAAADMTDRSIHAALEEHSGVRVVRSDFMVWAAAAQAETAELLDLEPGAPVLIGEALTYAQTGSPVLLTQTVYRSDAYRFAATLTRTHP
ncbi:GntR family transcriptional regulator [Murinocardiopsis flavida]|nr:GntR family transcriptional regulator [Murinocardiopsis flavida]